MATEKYKVPIEYIGVVDIPFIGIDTKESSGNNVPKIERIIAGEKIPLSNLDEEVRDTHHRREPMTNFTGSHGFLDFNQVEDSCDIWYVATNFKYLRQKNFENMLKFLISFEGERDINRLYAQVDAYNAPMQEAMKKYGFKRTGSIEGLICFAADIENLDI